MRLLSTVSFLILGCRHVEEVVHQPGHVLTLARDYIERLCVASYVAYPGSEDGHARSCRREGIAELMPDQRERAALAFAILGGSLVQFPELPRGGRKLRQDSDDPLVFRVELAVGRMADDPDRPDRRSIVVKRDEQRLDEARLRVQRREGAIGKVHQLRRVAVDADAARALGARHGAALRSGERAGHRLPPKHVAVEETQARRVGGAEIGGDFDEALQHVARVGGELAGQHPEREDFRARSSAVCAAASAAR